MDNLPHPPGAAVARLPKSKAYKTEVKKHLDNEFCRVSCQAIGLVLKHVDFHFPDAFHLLQQIQGVHDSIDASDSAESVMAKVQTAFPPMPNHVKVFIKQNRPQKRFRVTDQLLLVDMNVMPDQAANDEKGNNPPVVGTDHAANDKTENNTPAVAEGKVIAQGPTEAPLVEEFSKEEAEVTNENGLVECGCCYGDYPPEDMKECLANQGHQVCKGCIYRYVSEQLDGNNSIEFHCIIDENCRHTYHHATVLEQVLSPGLKRRANDAIYRSVVQQAGIEGLWTCEKCSCMGFLDTPALTVFCPNCNKMYCTNCHRPEHPKKTCEQVKADEDRAKNPVHRAHEKMSAAVTRRCPKCLIAFVKHDGCNKMTCSDKGCKTLSCYLCGVQVQDYSHFCNHARPNKATPCRCGKPCELFTSTKDMVLRDRMLRQQAGRKVLEEAGMDPGQINAILASPPAKKLAAKKAARPVPLVNPYRRGAPAPPFVPMAPLPIDEPAQNNNNGDGVGEGGRDDIAQNDNNDDVWNDEEDGRRCGCIIL